MPTLDEMQQMAQSAYSGKTLLKVGGFQLFKSTPTLKFYYENNVIIVSVRGTQDSKDFAAWPNVALGTLDKTVRFQEDLQTLLEVQTKYPPSQYHYVGVGHSLGAAILDRFLQMGLIQNCLSYNGAVEPQFVRANPRHRRIYNAADPLYNIVGHLIPGVEVRPITLATGIRSIFSSLYASYKSHMLSNFKGGVVGSGCGSSKPAVHPAHSQPLTAAERDFINLTLELFDDLEAAKRDGQIMLGSISGDESHPLWVDENSPLYVKFNAAAEHFSPHRRLQLVKMAECRFKDNDPNKVSRTDSK
jgi:hypothetical protein